MTKPQAPTKVQGAAGWGAGQSGSAQTNPALEEPQAAERDLCEGMGLLAQPAPHLSPLRGTFEIDYADFIREAIRIFDGSRNAPRVAVIDNAGEVSVDILGSLPHELRYGLTQVSAYWEPQRPGVVSWKEPHLVWCSDARGGGPRYAIPDLCALLDLVAECCEIREAGGAA